MSRWRMADLTTTRVVLVSRPRGMPTLDDFRVEEAVVGPLEPGQVTVEVDTLSVDAFIRASLNEGSLHTAVPLGGVLMLAEHLSAGLIVFYSEALLPVFTVVIAVALKTERLTSRRLTAVACALIGVAVALWAMERSHTLPTDTLLGVLAHAGLALGLIAIAFIEHVRVDLMGYLFGDVLAIGGAELWLLAAVAAASLACLAWLWNDLLLLTISEDLAAVEGVQEATGQTARRLVGLRRLLGQLVDAAVHVRVMMFVDVDQRLNHLPRPLRGGRVVEVDERLVSMNDRRENGEVAA